MTFEEWAEKNKEKLYDSWIKQENSALEWARYWWTLKKAFEAGQEYEKTIK